ncbi:calcium-binding protein, partial [Methylobacterium hispanicum]
NRGADTLAGGEGADIVYGNAGLDILFGGAGADTLYGGRDVDILIGDDGDDVLVGGLGGDLFVFDTGSGRDLVLGFDLDAGDQIGLAGQTFALTSAQNGDALLTLSGGGTVELAGVTAAAFGNGAGYLA